MHRLLINPSTTSTGIREVGTGFTPEFSLGNEALWNGTATYAKFLVDPFTGTPLNSDSFVTDNGPIILNNAVTLYSTSPLNLGPLDNIQFYTESGNNHMYSAVQGQNLSIDIFSTVKGPNTSAIYVDGNTGRIGIFTITPTSDLTVKGDVTIDGNLFVLGTQTNVTTQDLQVVDKVITLAWTTTGVLSTASYSGGGIELNSAPYRKYVKWFDEAIDADDIGFQTGSKNVWQASDNFELRYSTATYKIAGYDVITSTSLGDGITDAPGLVNIGNLSSATIGTLKFTKTGPYETTLGANPTYTTSTIIIGDNNIQDVQFAGRLLRNIQTPTPPPGPTSGPAWDDYLQQGATIGAVFREIDDVRNLRATLTIDVTGHDGGGPTGPYMDDYVIRYLGYMLDPTLPFPQGVFDGTVARVLCVSYATPNVVTAASDPITFDQLNVSIPGGGEATAIQWFSGYVARTSFVPGALTVYRCVKQYKVNGGVWEIYPLSVGGDNIVNRDDWPV